MFIGAAVPARRFRSNGLVLARGLWVISIVLGALFIAKGAQKIHHQLLTPCAGDGCESWQRADVSDFSPRLYADMFVARESALFLICVGISALIVWKAGNDWVAWLGAIMLVCFGGAVTPDMVDALALSSDRWRLTIEPVSLTGELCLALFMYLFPDGRIVPRRAKWFLLIWCALIVVGHLVPRGSLLHYKSESYLLFVVISAFLAIAMQVIRFRSCSTVVQRQQTKWVVFGFGATFVLFFIAVFPLRMIPPEYIADRRAFAFFGMTFATFSLMLIPLSIGLAMMRYRLWDVDLFINRALVSTLLTAIVVGFYVAMVASASAVLSSRGTQLSTFVATAIVAIGFQPLRARLQLSVNRLIYGDRDTPYSALSRLGQRLGAALTPDAVLPSIVESVAQALKTPYAAIAMRRDQVFDVVASTGFAVDSALTWPLINQQEVVGELRLAPRSPGEHFGAADRRLIDDIARQAGVAVHAVRLTSDLQRSRERLVTAREEERRRLRRDLHDGLGPQLASQMLTLDAARRLRETDPVAADALLDELRGHIQTAVSDIRSLVYELRPPALDDLGLVTALRERLHRFSDNGLRIEIEAADLPNRLPAAVEVAVYRIVLEAVTNVVRHAGALRATIVVAIETDRLVVEVIDDGKGIDPDVQSGVGLLSMKERAEELGGTCVISRATPRGTRVVAEFPLRGES